ncbi:hypothetical protein BDZ89DRAFT_1137258 [Hymenopellis radicata]|nr:hypothetical protein BDZ89DRAFT_1137258 [Hymenopellis radicata]
MLDEDAIANAMADAYISAMNDVDDAIDNDTIDELVNSSMVIINGFQFCKDHGNEACTPCEGDCRLNNNDTLPKNLYNRLKRTVWAGISPLSRPPINNIYKKYKPIPTGELHPTRRYEFYACHDHHEIDCNVCFDWMEVLEGKEKKEEPATDRRLILGLLKSMGVELPPDTKMRDEVLEKKFSAALTASQSLSSYGASSISPEKLPQWTVRTGKTSAFEAMNRASVTETLRAQESKRSGTADPFPLYENAFMDARQTSRHLAHNFEKGRNALVLRDKDNVQAICIRMLGVYKLDKDTPLISLIYETVTYSNPDEIANVLDFMYHLGSYGQAAQIQATLEEQALFRQLLAENSRRVSAKYRPPKESYEKTFQPSFVVPIGPLSQIDIGKLTQHRMRNMRQQINQSLFPVPVCVVLRSR